MSNLKAFYIKTVGNLLVFEEYEHDISSLHSHEQTASQEGQSTWCLRK
jgi:hypothetical protein